jgi:hypothetical protein
LLTAGAFPLSQLIAVFLIDAWPGHKIYSLAADTVSNVSLHLRNCHAGAFPLSQLIAVSLTDAWPGHKIYSLAADAVFHVPLWRHVMTW